MQIEEIVAKLQDEGLEKEAIIESLKEMLEKGEISQEDFDKALGMLDSHEEEELAKKLYGDDILE